MTETNRTLPHTRFDTTSEAPERRLATWREAIGVLFDVQPTEPEAAETPITLESWQLGPAVLTAGAGPGFSYDRSPRAVARDGRDLFLVQFYDVGRCRIMRGAPTTVTSEPGDLVITDLAHPMATQETAFRNINLLVPRSLLTPLVRAPDAQGGRVLRSDLPLVALARRHLQELARQAPWIPEAQAMDVLGVTAQLIAAALNGRVDPETVSGTHVALACQIRRFIEEHLVGYDLTPGALAGHFGLSRATLYRLFVREGGVHRYVQRRRLARARLDLIRPAQRHKTVAQIGAEAGYVHAQDFIRAYRREFGRSPGEERGQAHLEGRIRLPRRKPELPRWAEWVRDIG